MAAPVWVVETSSIIWIKSSIPRGARAGVFEALTRLASAGRLVFPNQVLKELQRDTGNLPPDAACQWAVSVEPMACANELSLDDVKAVLVEAADILDQKKDSGVDEADPYVLALARKLRNDGHDARVVVQEVRDTPTKLSLNTACGMLGIPSVPLLGLLRTERIPHG
jgi:hypothetical protein